MLWTENVGSLLSYTVWECCDFILKSPECSSEFVPDVVPEVSPLGAALSAFVLLCSSRQVKYAGFTHAVTWCRLRVKWKGCVFVWHVGWTPSCSVVSFSTGEICHSWLLCCFALELGKFQMEQDSAAVKGWQCQYSSRRTDVTQVRGNPPRVLTSLRWFTLLFGIKPREIKIFCSHLPLYPDSVHLSSLFPSIPHWLCGLMHDSKQGCVCR